MTAGVHAPPTVPLRASVWAQLAPLMRPWRSVLALAMLSVLLAKALELVPALLIQRIVDDHLAIRQADGMLALGLLYLGATVGAQILTAGAVYLTAVAAQGVLHTVRMRLVEHLQRLPLRYYDEIFRWAT